MNRMINNIKDLLPLGATLVTITAWGVLNFASSEKNNALTTQQIDYTNQRIDQLAEVQKEENQETKQNREDLEKTVDNLRDEVNRLAGIVDRADSRGLLGMRKPDNLLAVVAPNIAAITPTPAPTPQPIVYQTTITTDKTAGESATPTPVPTPVPQPTQTPERCLLGLICV